MIRRRANQDQQDSLDLLLDTVSNVFGGVMFLTLLAALLILSRSATREADSAQENVDQFLSTTGIDAEIRQTAAALAMQQQIQSRLDDSGSALEKTKRLESLEATLALAQRNAKRAENAIESQKKSLEDQHAKQSDLEAEIESLEQQVAEKSKANSQVRSASERTVEFRGLSRSMSAEAVVVLRYGRWYLLQTGKQGRYINKEDFFVIKEGSLHRVTPKPHKGQVVDASTLPELKALLRGYFSPQQFHVVIAVWDDSFSEFNPLKDAVKEAGFQYRTLPCDSSTRLSNQYAADAYVQ